MSWRKRLLAAALPLLGFAALEAALAAAGVRPLISRQDPFAGFASLEVFEAKPERGVRATRERATRQAFAPQEFRLVKPSNGFRLFTLGGSSAVGFPWGTEAAFTRLLGESLQATYPERAVEAVNASAMSYASHRLRLLAAELVRYQPDVFVLYEGHNEFVERRFYDKLRPAPLRGLQRVLFHSRLLTWLAERLPARRARSGGAATTGELLGFEVVREKGIFADDGPRREVERTFEANLRAILELAAQAGARVVLCTVASNVRDWRPHHSVLDAALTTEQRDRLVALRARSEGALRERRPQEALAALEQAGAISPGHAEIQFRLGRLYEEQRRFGDARQAYRRARDADAQPARASTAINDAIRRVARERGVPLLDVERLFEAASPHGLVGFNLIEDYVHPKPEGHRLIALELYRLFVREGLAGPRREPEQALFEAALERAAKGASVGQDDVTRRAAMLYNTAYVLASQGHAEPAMEKYRECLALNPSYAAARLNLGVLLYQANRPAEALEAFAAVLDYDPENQQARVSRGWALLALRRHAVEVFREATRHDARDPQAWYGLGVALKGQSDSPDETALAFKRASELEPNHPESHCALGEALLRLERAREAAQSFSRCAQLRPEQAAARAWLGYALERLGERERALAAYRAALTLDPQNPYAQRGLARLEGAAR